MYELFVYADGGARGNPGPSAIGVYITDENKNKVVGIGKKIGHATNNVAEYKAVIEGLSWIVENKDSLGEVKKINFFVDSLLVYSQIVGLFKVKNTDMRELIFSVREKEAQIKQPIVYKHIPREKNCEADLLVNKALDNLI